MNRGGNRGGFPRCTRNPPSSSGYQQRNHYRHDNNHVSTNNSSTFQNDGSSCINESPLQEQTSSDSAVSKNSKHIQGSALMDQLSRGGRHQYRQKPLTEWTGDLLPSFGNHRHHQHHDWPSNFGRPLLEQTSSEIAVNKSSQHIQGSMRGSGGIGGSSNGGSQQHRQESTERTSYLPPSSGYPQRRQHQVSTHNSSTYQNDRSSCVSGSPLQEQTSSDSAISNSSKHIQGSALTNQLSRGGKHQYRQKPPTGGRGDSLPSFGNQACHQHHEQTSTESTPEGAVSNSTKHIKDSTDNKRSSNIGSSQHLQIEREWNARPNSYCNQKKETLPPPSLDKYQSSQTRRSPQRTCADISIDQGSSEHPKTPPSVSSAALAVSTGKNDIISKTIGPHNGQPSQERGSTECSIPEQLDASTTVKSFDICKIKKETHVKLKAPLLLKNRERRKELSRAQNGSEVRLLRTGMVLLKNYISQPDQVKIIKVCRDLGQGDGGFYQPFFSDGGKMNLQMMCLGKNWNPETKAYEDQRSIDGAVPPFIPQEFNELVRRAILSSHVLIKQKLKGENPEEMVPWMEPDICIVNFYTNGGKLGLHQDKDESKESLHRGLPVVSFSIGDSADFLYGDERDVEKAEKVVLESGDVLIFAGKARHIFHGVTSILPDSAPKLLVEESNLRPGRLNLTFRQY